MNTNAAERLSDAPLAGSPTDELHQVEPVARVTESRELAEPCEALENRGVLDGLKVIGLA